MTKDELHNTAQEQNNAQSGDQKSGAQTTGKSNAGKTRAAQMAPHLQGPKPPAPKAPFGMPSMPSMPRILPVAQNIKLIDSAPVAKKDDTTE